MTTWTRPAVPLVCLVAVGGCFYMLRNADMLHGADTATLVLLGAALLEVGWLVMARLRRPAEAPTGARVVDARLSHSLMCDAPRQPGTRKFQARVAARHGATAQATGVCQGRATAGLYPQVSPEFQHGPVARDTRAYASASEVTKDYGEVPPAVARRVVVTGLGMVTPLGNDVDSTWEAILAGKTGIKAFKDPKFEGLPTQIGGYIEHGEGEGEFDAASYLGGARKVQQMAPFIQYAMKAAQEALDDADWHPDNDEDANRTGVSLGSGIGGIEEITQAHTTKTTVGMRKISPRFIPKMLINLAGGFVSMEHNCKGPNTAAVTACATGAHAIGDGYRFVKYGDADVMVCGGTESCVEPLSIAGFNQMKALCTANEDPAAASRPFDEARSGFVMGEGSGIMVLEELEHARKRGAKIYGEVRGVGYTGDAYHVSAPSGEGGRRAMQAALDQAGVDVADVNYINAHGTSTPVGDKMELETIQGLFGGEDNEIKPIVTSTKGATGHMLGAAGAVEAVITTLCVATDTIPPTLNLETPVVDKGIQHVTGEARQAPVNVALSNSFGFGGTNACICITKPPPS